jgi:hypothetical protein
VYTVYVYIHIHIYTYIHSLTSKEQYISNIMYASITTTTENNYM